MTVNRNTPKKKKRRLAPITKFFCLILVLMSAYMLYSVGGEVLTTFRLHKELSEVQEKLQEVQDENTYLTNEKTKLQDPDYVQSYARGNYMLTKDGEQIFYLPENTDK